jgi:hypothetical protein
LVFKFWTHKNNSLYGYQNENSIYQMVQIWLIKQILSLNNVNIYIKKTKFKAINVQIAEQISKTNQMKHLRKLQNS